MKNYPGKKLCKICQSSYHPDQYEMCWKCFGKQPARITQYANSKPLQEAINKYNNASKKSYLEPFGSSKDAREFLGL